MKKWNIGWGPISSCNMKCKFCYSKKVRDECDDLILKDWINFIDGNYEFINSINYGTGENTMSCDWFKLINHIGTNYPNITQALTTNGFLSEKIKDDNLRQIVVDSISEIDVSLDYCNRNKHIDFRGQNKAYEWAIETLKFCKEFNIKSTIVFLGTNETLNEENLKGLFEIGKKYNAKLRMNIYRPVGGIDSFTKKFIADYKKIVNALEWIADNHKILSISDPLFSSILTNNKFEADPSGIDSIRILSDGSITPSTYLISDNFRKYNINENHILKKISNESAFLDMNCQNPDECNKCTFYQSCGGGVYDRRYLWYSTFNAKDPYCPFRKENFLPNKKLSIVDENFESVHHGYLPTMFFKAK